MKRPGIDTVFTLTQAWIYWRALAQRSSTNATLVPWHGMPTTPPSTTAACASDAEVLDGLLGAPDSHDFCTRMADGIVWVGRLYYWW